MNNTRNLPAALSLAGWWWTSPVEKPALLVGWCQLPQREPDHTRSGSCTDPRHGPTLFVARDVARTIEASPGRFGRRAARVDQAQQQLQDIRQRWPAPGLPGSRWGDEDLRYGAARLAGGMVRAKAKDHIQAADRAEQAGANHDGNVTGRATTNVGPSSPTSTTRSCGPPPAPRRGGSVRASGPNALPALLVVATVAPEQVLAPDHARNAVLAQAAPTTTGSDRP